MTFKLLITQTKQDGTKNKVEIENSEPFQNQDRLFDFLLPLLQPESAAYVNKFPDFDFVELDAAPAPEEVAKTIAPKPKPNPVLKPKPEPEKVPISKLPLFQRPVSDRETGVVQIHCVNCGLETAKHANVRDTFYPCPTCETKLFMYPLSEVRGEPNELGVSFKANRVYETPRERWERENGHRA